MGGKITAAVNGSWFQIAIELEIIFSNSPVSLVVFCSIIKTNLGQEGEVCEGTKEESII